MQHRIKSLKKNYICIKKTMNKLFFLSVLVILMFCSCTKQPEVKVGKLGNIPTI